MRAARSLFGSSASATETLSRARPAVANLARLRIDVDPNTWSLAILLASAKRSTTNSNAMLRHHAAKGHLDIGSRPTRTLFAVVVAAVITRSHFPRQTGIHRATRSEEHTSELQSLRHLVCRLLLEKKKQE